MWPHIETSWNCISLGDVIHHEWGTNIVCNEAEPQEYASSFVSLTCSSFVILYLVRTVCSLLGRGVGVKTGGSRIGGLELCVLGSVIT